MPTFQIKPVLAAVVGLSLTGACMAPTTAQDALPRDPSVRAKTVAEIKDNLDAMEASRAMHAPANATVMSDTAKVVPIVVQEPTMVTGIGFAQIARQPGGSTNQRRLMALKAARMEALRDITEQVHGIQLTATTTISKAVIQNDQLNAMVEGTIRGARTVRITPKGSDGYEVELALDASTVAYILRSLQGRV